MELYVSDIEMIVAANGASALFKPGVPRPLRRVLIGPALARGARLVGDEPEDAESQAERLTVDQVAEAIRLLMAEGDSKAFGVTGEPKLVALRKKLGVSVSDELRDAAWAQVRLGE